MRSYRSRTPSPGSGHQTRRNYRIQKTYTFEASVRWEDLTEDEQMAYYREVVHSESRVATEFLSGIEEPVSLFVQENKESSLEETA